MKRTFFSCMIAIAAVAYANAQQISVVAPGGETKLFTDLNLAIKDAQAGSTIYLSGGNGFQVNDTTKITKKLTIIGIGHRPDNKNADGATTVGGNGNFFFNEGSDGSAVLGLYLGGNIYISNDNKTVNNILIRYCNVNGIQIGNYSFSAYSSGEAYSVYGSGAICNGIIINQNYIRGSVNGGQCPIALTNNVLGDDLSFVNGSSAISNNVFLNTGGGNVFTLVQNSQIRNNVFNNGGFHNMDNSVMWGNYAVNDLGADNTIIDWTTVFVGPNNGVNPSSNFHLADGNNTIGIYGGSGFSDTALPPGPRIVYKKIADQTDENGNLRVQIEVQVGSDSSSGNAGGGNGGGGGSSW